MLLAALALGLAAPAQELASPSFERPTDEELAERRALEEGLAYLAERQRASGNGSVLTGADEAGNRAPLAVTALSALAWMAGGSTPTRGPRAEELTRALEYLLASTERSADEHPGYVHDPQDAISRTHGHGLATLALAEAYTLSPRSPLGERIAETLALAVERIETSQGVEGGWYYDPFPTVSHEGSVTVCLVQGLRAARNVGVDVDTAVIARAIAYVKRLQIVERGEDGRPEEFGGFRYSLVDPQTSVALTAACLATLHATGEYDGTAVDEGYDYVWRRLAGREVDRDRGDRSSSASFPYYERFYLGQALRQHPDEDAFDRWVGPIVRELVRAQREDGSWEDVRYDRGGRRITGRYGASYATAMNCLLLAMDDGILPIFAR